MSKTIVVVGFGPGISTAVAEKFAAEGFSVALVGRSEERLAAGAEALKARGATAAGFVGDAGDPAAIRAALARARSAFGPLTVIHWNAYGGQVEDLVTIDPAAVARVFDIGVVGLLAAVQEALPDLKSTPEGAVLVTNGAFGYAIPAMDTLAITLGATGIGLANAAKHKLVGLLSERLKPEGVYVGEVMVAGAVKGTAFAAEGGIEGSAIADEFWRLYKARDEIRARIAA
jgi:NAD(P)-dependent dehydrogenase (short-subunit alcohol dehydrogenase family)